MPCKNVIARLLLKDGKAKVIQCEPFTIKLTYETTEYTQPLTLGIDTGSGTLGAAVVDNNGNVVYASKVVVRNDIKTKMDQRRKYRRNRRNRKTRYRKARFLNRKNSIRKERFSPTVTSKIQGHVREIEFVKSILPISKIVIECGSFDPHLLKNPLLANPKIRPWGYQQGENYGFANTRAMILARDNHTCQLCKGKHKDSKLEVHHIIFRQNGGSDEATNLITLCHTCHYDLHHGKISAQRLKNLQGKAYGQLKHASQMNVIISQLKRLYPEAIETFGYVTKANREVLGLPKEHYIDAAVIASGGNTIIPSKILYQKRYIADGDFKQTQGVRSEQRMERGKICGFRQFDKVKYFGKKYFILGKMSTGYAILCDIEGKKIDFSFMPKGSKTPKFALMKRLTARSETLIMTINLEKNQFVHPVKIINKKHLQKIETHQQLSLLDIM